MGTDGGWSLGEFAGTGNIFEKKNKNDDKKSKDKRNEGNDTRTTSFGALFVEFFGGLKKLLSGEGHSDYIIYAMVR